MPGAANKVIICFVQILLGILENFVLTEKRVLVGKILQDDHPAAFCFNLNAGLSVDIDN